MFGCGWRVLRAFAMVIIFLLVSTTQPAGSMFPVIVHARAEHVQVAGWNPLGSGVDGYVYAVAAIGTDVYAGGEFNMAGDLAGTTKIARWDGTNWHALGD